MGSRIEDDPELNASPLSVSHLAVCAERWWYTGR